MNNQQTPGPQAPPYIDEDEINLLDYVVVLLKHKWLIIGMVFIAGLTAVVVSLMLPNIYRSEATIAPRQQEQSQASSALSALGSLGGMAGDLMGLAGGGDLQKFEVVLKSREIVRRVVDKYKLMPELFEDEWDPLKKNWKEDPGPTMQDAYELIIKKDERKTAYEGYRKRALKLALEGQDERMVRRQSAIDAQFQRLEPGRNPAEEEPPRPMPSQAARDLLRQNAGDPAFVARWAEKFEPEAVSRTFTGWYDQMDARREQAQANRKQASKTPQDTGSIMGRAVDYLFGASGD